MKPGPSLPEIAVADPAWLADPETFAKAVGEQCRPFVLRGAFRDWPVVQAAAASPTALRDYLLRFANDVPVRMFAGRPEIEGRYYYAANLDGFNFEHKDLALAAALDQVLASAATAGEDSFYIGSVCTANHLPGFAAEQQSRIVPPQVTPRIWIGNASRVACHYDALDNVACVVAGRRRFTLFPPEAIANLYVGPIDHTMAGRPVSLASEDPSRARYPNYEAALAKAVTAELEPGDALYIPKLWWHRVEAVEPFNLLVNYWWDGFSAGPDMPYTAMLLSMIAIAERPEAERKAWRAFFDHYVFRPDGHPLAHLPEDKRGILGPLRKGNYGRIRAMVMQMLRGA
jgi:hypothetical protein